MQGSSWSQANWNSPDCVVRVCGCLLTGLRIELYPQSCPLWTPYLCHLWLQHQRFRTHPRNVYVDLTATWERNVLDTHTRTFILKSTNVKVPDMHLCLTYCLSRSRVKLKEDIWYFLIVLWFWPFWRKQILMQMTLTGNPRHLIYSWSYLNWNYTSTGCTGAKKHGGLW